MDRWAIVAILFLGLLGIVLVLFLSDEVELSPKDKLPCKPFETNRCAPNIDGRVICDGQNYCKCTCGERGCFWKGPFICADNEICRAGDNGGCYPKSDSGLGVLEGLLRN